jgi:hypothetical protein
VSATSLSGGEQPGVSPSEEASSTLRVEAVFRDVDERQAHTIASEMIGRAHELANLPECECDVDVSVRVAPPQDDDARGNGAL